MVQKQKLERCFIAIDPPQAIRDHLREVQEKLKKENLFVGKFTELENIHLTLKFLGEIAKEKVQHVREKLRRITFKSFQGSITKLGVFSENIMRILWIQVEGRGLNNLQEQIDRRLADVFPKEQRFMRHITIARIKQVVKREKLLKEIQHLQLDPQEWTIDEFLLKKSTLTSAGPIYETIEVYKLQRKEENI